MAKTVPVKRGPGRPRKNPLEVKSAPTKAAGAKRGRKPGIKNKGFLERVVIQSDAIEAALAALTGTLSDAIMKDDVVKTQNLLTAAEGLVRGISETLTDAVGKLSNLPEGYVPGKREEKILSWETGAYCVFKNPVMAKQFGKDAFEIVSVLELGKGPGNGTMIQLADVGMVPKSQLELVDGDSLEVAEPEPVKNGKHAAPTMLPAEVIAQTAPSGVDDDLNA